ncbi:MAG TPA: hypothetical protein VKA02_02200 [Candidatus Acidoferrum sp.]|nr:hypothetical protein [Candidatus Acidoferrum sp.]
MAIESYSAAKNQLAAESRGEFFPGIEIVAGIVKKAAGLTGFELLNFAELSLDAIQRNSKENLTYLFESLVEDVRRIDLKQESFDSATKDQREALNELVSEAVVRSAEAKSKQRVRRISRVLANAFRSGPKENYEKERELIDAATQIAESDAFILGVMMRHQGPTVKNGPGVADINLANETWKKMRELNEEFRSPHIHVSCARLQAHGLIIRMDRNTSALDLATIAYSMTTFGVQFCEWCLQELVR